MKLLEPKCYLQQVGETELDICYMAEQEILLDDGGHFFAGVQLDPEHKKHYFIADKSVTDPELTEKELKVFERKKNASKYCPEADFDNLDDALVALQNKYLEQLDDTAYQGGIRGGSNFVQNKMIHYVEGSFRNSETNESIYLQVIKTDDEYHYSVTDTSIYMRMNLGPLYDGYFTNKKDVNYLYDGDDLESLGRFDCLKGIFKDLTDQLNERAYGMGFGSSN